MNDIYVDDHIDFEEQEHINDNLIVFDDYIYDILIDNKGIPVPYLYIYYEIITSNNNNFKDIKDIKQKLNEMPHKFKHIKKVYVKNPYINDLIEPSLVLYFDNDFYDKFYGDNDLTTYEYKFIVNNNTRFYKSIDLINHIIDDDNILYKLKYSQVFFNELLKTNNIDLINKIINVFPEIMDNITNRKIKSIKNISNTTKTYLHNYMLNKNYKKLETKYNDIYKKYTYLQLLLGFFAILKFFDFNFIGFIIYILYALFVICYLYFFIF